MSRGLEYLEPLPARSIVLGTGFRTMPEPESSTSSRVPSLIPYFSLSRIGIVVWPFLVTTTSSVIPNRGTTRPPVLHKPNVYPAWVSAMPDPKNEPRGAGT